MATTVAALQAMVAANLGSEVGDNQLEATDLLADLNQVYRFDIPNRVRSPRFIERVTVSVSASTTARVDLNSAPGTAYYGSIVESDVSIKKSGETTSNRIKRYTASGDFWLRYDVASTDEARPTGILIEETLFTLRLIPDATYTVYLDAIKFRPALAQGDTLHLDWEVKALEYMASVYAAMRIGDEETVARMSVLAESAFWSLRSVSRMAPHVPQRRSDF